jgi:hypothetical protein
MIMDIKVAGSLLVLGCLSLAIIANRPRFLTERSNRETTAVERLAMRYLGIPVIWGFVLALLASTVNQGHSAFLTFVFRLSLAISVFCLGANGLIHGLLVWPLLSESDQPSLATRLAGWLPATIILILGCAALVAAYTW